MISLRGVAISVVFVMAKLTTTHRNQKLIRYNDLSSNGLQAGSE